MPSEWIERRLETKEEDDQRALEAQELRARRTEAINANGPDWLAQFVDAAEHQVREYNEYLGKNASFQREPDGFTVTKADFPDAGKIVCSWNLPWQHVMFVLTRTQEPSSRPVETHLEIPINIDRDDHITVEVHGRSMAEPESLAAHVLNLGLP